MQSDAPHIIVENPTDQADAIARIVAMEVAHQLRPLEQRIALLERAVAVLQDGKSAR